MVRRWHPGCRTRSLQWVWSGRQREGNTMRKKKEASGALLAIGLVLSLVGMWTGWTETVAAWVAGHLIDLIPYYSERSQ